MPKLTVDLDCIEDMNSAMSILRAEICMAEAKAPKTAAEPAGEHPLPPDLAQQVPATSPATPKRRGRPPASDAESSSLIPEPSKADFVVFDTAGERIAGYANSADAATVLITKAKELMTSADLTAFGKANLATMARLAKEDGARVQVEIGAHIAAVKRAEAEAPPFNTDGGFGGLFGGTQAASSIMPTPQMDRATFVKEMTRIGGLMGAQEGKAFLTQLGFAEVAQITPDRYAEVVQKCDARVKILQAGPAAS